MGTSHIWSFHGEREMKKDCLKRVCLNNNDNADTAIIDTHSSIQLEEKDM